MLAFNGMTVEITDQDMYLPADTREETFFDADLRRTLRQAAGIGGLLMYTGTAVWNVVSAHRAAQRGSVPGLTVAPMAGDGVGLSLRVRF